VRRDGNLRLTPSLVLDAAIVIILPLVLSLLIPLPSATMQELFLSGFLFYLSISVIYLLFTSNATRLLIPYVTLFLLLAVSVLSLRFIYDLRGSSLVLFAYYFLDEITLSTFIVSSLAALLPLIRQIGFRIGTVLDSRHLENTASENETKRGSSSKSISNGNQEITSIQPTTSTLRKAVRLFRSKEYRQCIEFCDAEIERIILSKLVGPFSAKIDLPMSLRAQISKLMSNGVSLPGQDILQLRQLRNSLTMSSQEVSAHKAKWAIRLMRRAKRTLESSNTIQNHSKESQRWQTPRTFT
jgi:hypothetical protein